MNKEVDDYKVVFCTPKLTSLTIMVHRPTTFPAPSACHLPFLEEVNIIYSFHCKSNARLIVMSWLQLLANVKIITLDFETFKMVLMVSYFTMFSTLYIFDVAHGKY